MVPGAPLKTGRKPTIVEIRPWLTVVSAALEIGVAAAEAVEGAPGKPAETGRLGSVASRSLKESAEVVFLEGVERLLEGRGSTALGTGRELPSHAQQAPHLRLLDDRSRRAG